MPGIPPDAKTHEADAAFQFQTPQQCVGEKFIPGPDLLHNIRQHMVMDAFLHMQDALASPCWGQPTPPARLWSILCSPSTLTSGILQPAARTQCSATQHVSMRLPSLCSAAQPRTFACPCPHSAMQNTVLQRGIGQPCRHAAQQCSAVQNATALAPILSSAAQPSTPACSCSPSAMHHTLPQHGIAQPCRHAKQHAWLQPGLPEAVAAHVVSHDAAFLGHPLVSSAG